MKKGRMWSRILAVLLASVMLLTNQGVVMASEVVSDSVMQESENPDPDTGTYSVTEEEETNGGSEQTSQSDGQTSVSEQSQTKADTQEQAQSQQDPSQTDAAKQSRTSQPEESASLQSVQPTVQPNGVRIGEDSGAVFTSVAEMAEAYYGENASNPQTAGSVTISSSHTGTTVMAGDELQFTLAYTMNPAPLYNYGEQTKPLFDTYDNTTIRFRLPEGMSLVDEEHIVGAKASYDKDTGEWVFTLDNTSIDASASSTGSFSIRVVVDGNGALEVGKQFVFDIQDNLSMTTQFSVYDKTDSANPVKVKDYTQTKPTVTQSLPTLTSTSPDQWGLEKTHESNQVSDDKKTVTVHWTLAFGLRTADGEMVTNEASYYQAHGRAPFAGKMTLSETLAVGGKDDLTPTSVKITEKFGDQKTYTVANGGSVQVDTDTCGAHSVSGIDANAPYYSSYDVEVVYDYQEFITKYSETNGDQLTVENTAQATYQLKGAQSPVTVSDTAQTKIGETIQPAILTIEKRIEDYDGNGTRPYAEGTAWDPVSGSAEFTVTTKDGKPADLYTKNQDGSYTKLTGNTVSIDPSKAGEDGSVTVYLDAGDYQVEETKAPENTTLQTEAQEVSLKEEVEKTVTFTNKETLGGVQLHKVGHRDNATSDLKGAKFGIYSDQDCQTLVDQGETNASGMLTFDRLKPGTYYVKETEAPEGYLLDPEVYPVTVKENEVNTDLVEEAIVNEYNLAHLRLQKTYQWFSSGEARPVNESNYQEFARCFTLQQSTDKKLWTDVPDAQNMSLTVAGTTYATDLPVYQVSEDGTRTAIWYRYREVLPENWHGEDEIQEGTDRVLYSEPVTLEDVIGNSSASPKDVTMLNSRNGDLELTKEYVRVNPAGSQTTESAKKGEATFDLYQQVEEESTFTHYGTYTTDDSGRLQASNLPGEKDGKIINYYWVEVPKSGSDHLLETEGQQGSKAQVTTITLAGGEQRQAVGPFYFRPKTTNEEVSISQDVTVRNVEQKVPVRIKKLNTLTNSWMAGAKITIYRVDEDGTETPVTGYEDVEIPNAGYLAVLEAGYQYVVKETGVPAHFTCVNGPITIDLTDVKVTGNGVKEQGPFTVQNKPDPSVTIDKILVKADGSRSDLKGTGFEVYQKNGDQFTPVTDPEGKTLILEAGDTLYLDAGTDYYLHEVVTDQMQVLDPDQYPQIYQKLHPDSVVSGDKFFFGPYEVKDQQELQDLGEITNVSSLGGLEVTKTDRSGTALKGAGLEVYYEDAQGQEHIVGTGTTPENGKLTFKDLPIYEADGTTKRVYHIRETQAPNGYYGTSAELTTTLNPQTIVTKVNGEENGAPLTLENHRYQTFTVNKVYYNVWEYAFTKEEIPLEGTTIALYKKGDDGNYHWVENQVTDSLGQVVFENLTDEEGDEYVAVEVDIPQTAKDQYVYPQGNKEYLPDPAGNESVKILSATELEKYNYAVMNEENQGKLTNEIGWTQLRIDKYMMRREDPEDEDSPETVNTPANYCQFQLYQQIVDIPEGQTDVTLTFDAENCTLIGEYSSGTFVGTDGEPVDGKFATDILDVADNIVYWLVETQAGPGAQIMPENNYILFTRAKGAVTYHNNSQNGVSTRVEKYPDNKYGEYDVENEAVYGPGQDYYASVRLQKWAGSYSEDGDKQKDRYEPLGNASYELWVVNESGDLLEKVDDITVGLESDLETGEMSAMGMSRALRYGKPGSGEGFDKYNTEAWEAAGNDDDIVWKDPDSDCYYVRMALRESYVPYGYQIDAAAHYMIVRFTPTGEGMTYNDAYFVTEAEAKDIPLADEQTEIQWPGRFTLDGETTEYEETGENLYRLVNWPLTNFSVTVQKYGYEPGADAPFNRTADQLDAWFESGHTGRVPLEGVTMKLQRYDGGTGGSKTWKDYDYEKETWGTRTFQTNGAGAFTFPKGLDIGQYRIVETAMPKGSDYEILYDGKSVSGGTGEESLAYRYFRVSSESLVISMYNPEKISLSLEKQDMGGNPAKAEFTLTKPGAKEPSYKSSTGASGEAVFSHIDSGTWYLGESSNEQDASYFKKYMAEVYPQLKDFVDETKGISFGYTKNANSALGDVVVSDVLDLKDYQVTDALLIRNPDLTSLEIQKLDAETNELLTGATFEVYYQAFDTFGGTHTVRDMTDSANRTPIGQYNTTNGKITLTGLKPGVYYLVETSAPGGYELAEDKDQVIALKGGMEIQVSGAERVFTGDGDALVTFKDQKLTSIEVSKTIDTGDFTKGPDSYQAVFRLYDSLTGTTPVNTATASKDTQATFTGLRKGHTYYLEEQADSEYVLQSVNADGAEVEREENGRYAITPTTGQSAVQVEVTNTWLYARVTVLKVDGNTGEPLTDAAFVLQEKGQDAQGQPTWNVVGDDRATWTKGNDGTYTVTVRLNGSSPADYRIREDLAPAGYLADQTPIEVTLEPGDVKTYDADGWQAEDSDDELRDKLIVPNYNGVTIKIQKYGNMHGSASLPEQSNVTFRMYTYDEENMEWRHMDSQKTYKDGIATFTVAANHQYAVSEETVPGGYAGLDGIWTPTGSEITDTIQADGQVLYPLSSQDLQVGKTYTYYAYNTPLVELEVQKKDANSGTELVPKARVSVYEVPDGTGTDLTREEVNALKVPEKLVDTVETTKEGTGYSYMDGIQVVPGRTYLVVEDEVTGTSGYDTMILDDRRVVWYQVVKIPEGTTKQKTVTLENVLGTAAVSVDKSSYSQSSKESLYEQGSQIVYTLDPEVNNTYALEGFTLTDTGLKAYHGTGGTPTELDYDRYLKDQYTIRQVRLGQADHETGYYEAADGHAEAGVIRAKVTFIDFEGGEHPTEPVIVSSGEQVVSAPRSWRREIRSGKGGI